MAETPTLLDLSTLPPRRREKVLRAYDRERAAERIREVYPIHLNRWTTPGAIRETAKALQAEGLRFVSERFVRAVMREGR